MTGVNHLALRPDAPAGTAPGPGYPAVTRLHVPQGELEPAVHQLSGSGARLADLFADTSGEAVVLHLVWALDADGRYVVLDCPITGEAYPPLSDIAPAAFLEECEIYEQFGLRPAGDKSLNRVAVPPHADRAVPRLGRAPTLPPQEVHAPHVVGGQAFEFPVGPVRGVGLESLYLGLVTSGEEVVDLYLFTWHKHRGVEHRLRGKSPRQALFLAERAEGLSAVAHGWAFAAAVEDALEIAVAEPALAVRALALELERMYNHANAVVALCQSTGLAVGQAGAEIALERMLRLNAAVFGHRYLFGVLDIGGTARAPDVDALRRDLPAARGELMRVTDALATTNSFLDRLEACGTVTAEQAHRLGLVGPVARGSGVDIDTRRDHPRHHALAAPPVVLGRAGDALSRFEVFVGEFAAAAESALRLAGLSTGCAARTAEPTPAAGTGLGWAESPRGEALAWVRLDETGRVARARLRPAAVRNWRAFDDAARSGNVFTDIPIIEASFWLTVAGTAR